MHKSYCTYPHDPCDCGELERKRAAYALEEAPELRAKIRELEAEVERLRTVLEVIARNPVGDSKPEEPFSSTSYVAWFVINLAREALEDKEVKP